LLTNIGNSDYRIQNPFKFYGEIETAMIRTESGILNHPNHFRRIDQAAVQIPILGAGNGWLVVDKPAGMAVHNDPGSDMCACVLDFISANREFGRQVGMEPDFGVNPVHRLDRETSGVLLLATTRKMFRFFSRQFESRQVKKRYIAVLHGIIESPGEDDAWKTWDWALSKSAAGRKNPKGPAPRQPCETRYRVIDHSIHYTLAEIELLTGRTHQIRRHAKLSGHPVVGDARYGSTRALTFLKKNCAFDRLGLHAQSLTVRLLGGDRPETFKTPDIPGRMRILFENDRARDTQHFK